MRKRLTRFLFLLLLLIAPIGAQGERRFPDEDLSGLARSLSANFEARFLGRDTQEAKAKFEDKLEALGLSFVDALDPSPNTIKHALSDGPAEDFHGAYGAEKTLPAWLRFGGAVYGERYFFDAMAQGESDPFWARQWSLENLRQRGGLRPLDELLAFKLDPDDRADGQNLLLEAGLLVAFVVDGACEPVSEAHTALKQALVTGHLVQGDVERLVEALVAHESELRAFSEL